MNEISTTLKKTYDWSIDRMNELCTEGDIEQLKEFSDNALKWEEGEE